MCTIFNAKSHTFQILFFTGTLDIVHNLEKMMAEFLGVEDCIVFGMGFAANTMNIPVFGGRGCLLISDELNHASIILGSKLTESSKKIFKHNGWLRSYFWGGASLTICFIMNYSCVNRYHDDFKDQTFLLTDTNDLERILIESIADGQPKTRQPWCKIIIIVEGVYSMEGSIVDLPRIIYLKKKYKAYLYIDEAHSIGVLGKSGRGVCDHFGIETTEVDLLMGTFTKSFAAAGGYVAGSKELIDCLRVYSHSFAYGNSMAAPIAQQILLTMEILMDGGPETEGEKMRKMMKWWIENFHLLSLLLSLAIVVQ